MTKMFSEASSTCSDFGEHRLPITLKYTVRLNSVSLVSVSRYVLPEVGN